jgi:hypothetical protein
MAQNTGTIAVEQKQPYDKYYMAQNTGTIPVEPMILLKVALITKNQS